MSLIRRVVIYFSKRARLKRANSFKQNFIFCPETRILDLGSANGEYISAILQGTNVILENVYIADISEDVVNEGHKRFGFTPVIISEFSKLPFPDNFFDIIFCSAVIEHVTIPKNVVWRLYSAREFKRRSLQRQKEFATEIARVGKSYFVQTPYKWFPIESHTWMPFVGWLPRPILISLIRLSNRMWVKKTKPDWCLLTKKEMSFLFPEANIRSERFLGLTKSIMAVKRVGS